MVREGYRDMGDMASPQRILHHRTPESALTWVLSSFAIAQVFLWLQTISFLLDHCGPSKSYQDWFHWWWLQKSLWFVGWKFGFAKGSQIWDGSLSLTLSNPLERSIWWKWTISVLWPFDSLNHPNTLEIMERYQNMFDYISLYIVIKCGVIFSCLDERLTAQQVTLTVTHCTIG